MTEQYDVSTIPRSTIQLPLQILLQLCNHSTNTVQQTLIIQPVDGLIQHCTLRLVLTTDSQLKSVIVEVQLWIPFHRVSSAGRTQRHRTRYWWRSRRCTSFTRPQLSFRLCWPLHSTVNPTIQVLRHRAATGVVPFIPNWTYAGVYSGQTHPITLTSGVPQARVLVRHNLSQTPNVQPIYFPYTQFNTTCLPMTHSPTVTVQYLRFLH